MKNDNIKNHCIVSKSVYPISLINDDQKTNYLADGISFWRKMRYDQKGILIYGLYYQIRRDHSKY